MYLIINFRPRLLSNRDIYVYMMCVYKSQQGIHVCINTQVYMFQQCVEAPGPLISHVGSYTEIQTIRATNQLGVSLA